MAHIDAQRNVTRTRITFICDIFLPKFCLFIIIFYLCTMNTGVCLRGGVGATLLVKQKRSVMLNLLMETQETSKCNARTVITVYAYGVEWILHLHYKAIPTAPSEEVVFQFHASSVNS